MHKLSLAQAAMVMAYIDHLRLLGDPLAFCAYSYFKLRGLQIITSSPQVADAGQAMADVVRGIGRDRKALAWHEAREEHAPLIEDWRVLLDQDMSARKTRRAKGKAPAPLAVPMTIDEPEARDDRSIAAVTCLVCGQGDGAR